MNNFKVEIYDNVNKEYVDYTSKAVFPLKFADLLDEQLDECELTLKRVLTPFINPLTLVRVTITNSPKAKYSSAYDVQRRAENTNVTITYDSTTKRITETKVLDFVVANDSAIEQPVGSDKYNHQLYLIETTKILEGYIGDSISFTNALGNDYVGENSSN
jgi:hypothetical protein